MLTRIKQGFIVLTTLLISFAVHATPPVWQIVPEESSLKFVATQNGSPVDGEFKKFNGDISYDPNQMADSFVKMTVEVDSLSDPLNQIADTLKGADWFDTKTYPQAVFVSNEFVKTGSNTFQVKGKLTLRDKTLPVTLDVKQVDFSPTKAHMEGSTTISRTAFGVGKGQWANTSAIKDDVKINFVIVATKK